MNKLWTTALVAALFLALAAPAYAAIEIRRINFNPDGRDTATNSHLNREYIYLVNTGRRAKQLRGWKVHDKGRDHVYRVPRRTVLRPGEYAYVYSGRGRDGASVGCNGPCVTTYFLYWDSEEPVWNNTGDVATLRNRSGNVVDRCRYGSGATNPKRC